MLDKTFAETLAREWIAAWNSHDLARILAHYRDDFEMRSPYIAEMTGERSGRLLGKPAVAAYWAEALRRLPELHFEHLATLTGVDSLTIHYRGARGLAAEVLWVDEAGKIRRAAAHYQ
ncbi:nuclear transport factor 2 family protein [Chromobacterium sp. CV08]|uniref:nuclear transport factor 2 family protein n=1 Tax=Chromobacterium sp. CV08 TaxID=3133274 RepID=UPI003DA99EE9